MNLWDQSITPGIHSRFSGISGISRIIRISRTRRNGAPQVKN
ncbi:hypothetical protein [Burkholderia contaminans]|nr:hypothetical protein [Burkholderia contaminans]